MVIVKGGSGPTNIKVVLKFPNEINNATMAKASRGGERPATGKDLLAKREALRHTLRAEANSGAAALMAIAMGPGAWRRRDPVRSVGAFLPEISLGEGIHGSAPSKVRRHLLLTE
jgi:hypothetical protein